MLTPATEPPKNANACLILADGTVFFGEGIGRTGITLGELCFNTAMTGYQEVLTDPSYAGQIITFTFPHIGNVGCNAEDVESTRPYCSGLVIREPITRESSFRSSFHLNTWLQENGVTGISGVDTRALTRHIRTHGAQNGAICFLAQGESFDLLKLQAKLAGAPSMKGMELAKTVTTPKHYAWREGTWKLTPVNPRSSSEAVAQSTFHVVAIDYGEKLNILRCLAERECSVTVVPATTSAEEILALKPDGVFLSNGPGDPSATIAYAGDVLRTLIERNVPIFGICLGFQLLGLALGASTQKMAQGHRGANHPVKNLESGAVEITSQNHGFCVMKESLPQNVKVTHVSLFDGCLEGFRATDKPVFAVQYHPESSPGPHDSMYLFDQFIDSMKSIRVQSSEFGEPKTGNQP